MLRMPPRSIVALSSTRCGTSPSNVLTLRPHCCSEFLPKQYTLPLLRTHVVPPAAATWSAPSNTTTCCGCSVHSNAPPPSGQSFVDNLTPSCPRSAEPQHRTRPFTSRAHECHSPSESCAI